MKHKSVILANGQARNFGIGIQPGNPRRCILCGEPIQRGEHWRKDTSPYDPQFGSYSILRHSPKCPNPKAYRAFQKEIHMGN